jgi:hypothetical protein
MIRRALPRSRSGCVACWWLIGSAPSGVAGDLMASMTSPAQFF